MEEREFVAQGDPLQALYGSVRLEALQNRDPKSSAWERIAHYGLAALVSGSGADFPFLLFVQSVPAPAFPVEGVYGQKRQRFKCTLRPKEEWIPISVPPLIDLATFHQAAARVRDNQAFSPRNLQEGGYLLRKLLITPGRFGRG